MGVISDDVWEDVRSWLVAQGREMYGHVLTRPEAIPSALGKLSDQDDLSLGEQLLHLEGDA